MTVAKEGPAPRDLDGLVQAFTDRAWSDLEVRALAIIREWPQAAIGWKAYGLALVRTGRPSEALAPLDRARTITPGDDEIYAYAGDAYTQLGQLDRAVACYQAAAELKPSTETHSRIGGLLVRLERFAEAEPSFRQALELAPADANAHYNLGNILRDVGKLDQAEESYRQAIAIEPGRVDAMANLAQVMVDLGRSEEALAYCRKAIDRRPDYALAHWNKSLIDLRLGNFGEGWRGYEWRWRYSGFPTPKRELPRPLWLGEEPIVGKTIAVVWEQGLGDTIQFCRYLPLLKARGARVLFAPQPVLRGLMTNLAGSVELVDFEDLAGGRREYDFWTPLLSLPLTFRADGGIIPASVPYLRADLGRVERWRSRIGDHGFKIGICWQGRPGKDDRGRSFPLASFAGIARLPGVRLVSLHRGSGEGQLACLPDGMTVEVLGEDLDAGADAFLDTAAVMESLDLLVTSDTAVAHLAGALGVRTWVVLKAVPDWRWQLKRNDSSWYPSMRLFRQRKHGDWSGVFAEIEIALNALPIVIRPVE